ncbi:putative metal-dependent hydrolase [Fibrella aestuarina BUZ 2]|uniref:Putative metal-dependent hydrolase n=1 Tax=Fibrella aestuarina BUZ 2 TaxID=1166018 RepID=I0KD87_9BACT|nr:putative metal-dependent hydrolase [Fibrella aestuarina]CCH02090.1 putative metal-dependent hydrolase [Fibrella aestuarina BUZ 2]
MQDLDLLRYPIGLMPSGLTHSPDELANYIAAIEKFPRKLAALVTDLSDGQLDTPYRPGGWTVRQVVHHLADSHINAYVRTRLALTEDRPTISPYEEAEWAKLPDSALPIAPSLSLLANLHLRWVVCLKTLTDEQLQRTYYHPGNQAVYTLADLLAMYAWHGEHHYQHIIRLAQRNGWIL